MDLIQWFALAEPSVKISSIALLLSVSTAIAAVVGQVFNVRSFRAARRQEKRRQPRVDLSYLESRSEDLEGGKRYIFRMLFKNPSDVGNSIASAELEARYKVDNSVISMRLASDPGIDGPSVPFALAAGASLEVSISFTAPGALLTGRSLRDFVVHFQDTYGSELSVPVEIVYAAPEGRR
ncbi:hypothetical protein [Serinibacter arcticus]|uniref:hypothetical protein n=1 Tax=Serinibacter arcticus TaxID=1655435 RepID=UPI001092088B|nr:hypothetical protein [Serinibacter arcticus]